MAKDKNNEHDTELTEPDEWCLIHKKPHPLSKCRAFRAKSIAEKKALLKQHRVCYRCLASTNHSAKDCRATIECSECQRDRHLAVLHIRKPSEEEKNEDSKDEENRDHGGELQHLTTKCTTLCGDRQGGRSCSKICLANLYSKSRPSNKIKAYVVVDDQSNCSLAKSKLFERLGINNKKTPFTLRTCSGTAALEGRRARDLVIESLDERKTHLLPTVIECNAIPDSKEEIPTPAVAKAYTHLQTIANEIPEMSSETDILLLVGRDAPPLHKEHESRNGKRNSPWAQRLDLGWVILGNVCLDGAPEPSDISTYKTHLLPNGRPSILEPCPNKILVKHRHPHDVCVEKDGSKMKLEIARFDDGLAKDVFKRTKEDDKPGPSIEDRKFAELMGHDMVKSDEGNWVAPLPFRNEVESLPSSRDQALRRLYSTQKTLERKPVMKQHYFAFMGKILDNGHAELVPQEHLESSKPCWYLPHFGVYHPQKPGKIRVVFDSAAEVNGTSLNKLLLSGPDSTNSLLGVLLRFRQNPKAFMADIEQMFHSFLVKQDHRDFLRFLWFEDNNPDGKVVEYRMRVHLFGNTSSPAIATFGLRKTARAEGAKFGADAKEFVENDFYVDDGLKSVATTAEAIDLLKRTQAMLVTANLRLSSNDPEITNTFPVEDRAADPRDLDLNHNSTSIQRSLGVSWDIESDTFTFKVSPDDKPFTKRGVLSVINSLYDPVGIAAPVLIQGKGLLRLMTNHLREHQPEDWDTPLPNEFKSTWDEWCTALSDLERCKVPRAYTTTAPLRDAQAVELHTFCDASFAGIAAVTYLKIIQPDGQTQVSFVFGKAKLAPPHATTIPRLELCAAVLAVEITELILNEHVVQPDLIRYYSDSRVVLGYIANETRRFYVYVSNRVERIRKSSMPDQCRYVSTHHNPADLATRPAKVRNLGTSMWLSGPPFLKEPNRCNSGEGEPVSFEPQPDDPEVRPWLQTLSTTLHENMTLGTARFARFSSWVNLVAGTSKLIQFVRCYRLEKNNRESIIEECQPQPTISPDHTAVGATVAAEVVIVRTLQQEAYDKEIQCVNNAEHLPKSSPLLKLSPIIDTDGILRVGGRLDRANITNEEQHPVILAGSQHVTHLLVQHLHNDVKHQGRHFTQGIIRAKGYWIIGEKRLVNKVIHHCLKCRKLRGKQQQQKMADLPLERLTSAPPFTFVGLDMFGPWEVLVRKTRGGVACDKRWAVIFTCLTIRAIHIELIESMSTSSFINALRRLFAIRGPATQIRCDNGTNFVGAHNELGSAIKEMDKEAIDAYLNQQQCEWVFNPPHGSHMGGVWERMIGISRKVLDSMLADLKPKRLTHEVLSTLMAEVAAIVNNRPLTPVSNDPSMPEVFTPSTLLTQKPSTLKATPGKFSQKDLYLPNKQWRQVQHLANIFWSRWRREFLPLLQPRQKWETDTRNLKEGDLVLLRSKEVARNEWPLARVTKAYPSEDGKVRKLEIMTAKEGARNRYVRPITEVILLKTVDELNSKY